MRDVERVVTIDVAVRRILEMIEDVALERVRRLHNEGVCVQPPEPNALVSKGSHIRFSN